MKTNKRSTATLDFKVFLLSITGIKGPYRFLDLKLVLKSFDCFESVGDEVFTAPTGDPCTGYIYGRQFLFLMTRLNIGESAANSLAIIIFLSFLLMSAAIIALRPSSKRSTFFGLLVFCSPGCWLLVERTNLDIVIFALIFLSVISIRKEVPEIAVILIVMSAFIKFYTFPLALIVLYFIRKPWRKIISLVFILLSGLLLIYEIVEIPTLPGTWYVSFGNQILFHWWNLLLTTKALTWPEASPISGSVVGAVLVLICSIMILKLFAQPLNQFSKNLDERLVKRELVALAYLFSTSTLLICYFAGMNYDYRLFYEGITCLIAFKIIPKRDKLLRVLVSTTLVSLWCSSFFYGMEGIRVVIIHVVGDVFTGITVSINLMIFVKLIIIRFSDFRMKSQSNAR